MSVVSYENGATYVFDQWSPDVAKHLRKTRPSKLVLEGEWGDFSQFAEVAHGVEALTINTALKDPAGLRLFSNIRILAIRAKPKRELDFSSFPHLEICNFYWTGPQSLSVFTAPRIERVTLHSFGMDTFEQLPLGSQVRSLHLIQPRAASLAGIGNLSALDDLRISNAAPLTSLNGLERLQRLASLILENARKVHSINEIGALRDLQKLVLVSVGGAEEPKFISGLKELKALQIGGLPTNIDWSAALALPKLEKIFILCHRASCPDEGALKKLAEQGRKAVTNLEQHQAKATIAVYLDMIAK